MAKKIAPSCIIIAGPNGAGKTTFARSYLLQETSVLNFINADLIATGLSPLKPERAARAAGRILLEELDRLTKAKESFALESTLSGKTYIKLIEDWKKMGYQIEVVFLRLDDPRISLNRIAVRVAQGGHNVPKEDALRRFERGLRNFENFYGPLADEWILFDASGSIPVLVGSQMKQAVVKDDSKVQAIVRAMKRAAKEARRQAKIHGTKVWVMVDGKVVGLKP